MGIDPVSIALMAGSYFLQNQAQSDSADRQRNIAAQMGGYDKTQSAAALDATNKYLGTITPEARTQDLASAQGSIADRLGKGVSDVQGFEKGKDFAGKVSPSYTASAAAGDASNADRVKRLISNLSVIGAPGAVNMADASRYNVAAANVGSNMDAMNAVNKDYHAAINTVQPDPLMSFLGQAAGAFGGSGYFKPQPGAKVPAPNSAGNASASVIG